MAAFVNGIFAGFAFPGDRQRRDFQAPRNTGFMATVSSLAFIA